MKAARITVTFFDASADGMVPGFFIKNWADANTLQGSTIPRAKELPTCRTTELSDSGSQRKTLTYYVDIAEFMGLSPVAFDASYNITGAPVTDNPASTPYLSIAAADARASGTAKTCLYNLEIEYLCHFFQRRMPASS